MGRKLYIKDDTGREFTNMDWALSDTKVLAGVLMHKDYLAALQTYFGISLEDLNQIQLYKEIQQPSDEHWYHIKFLLREVKNLKFALFYGSQPHSAKIYEDLNNIFMHQLGNQDVSPAFTEPYFVNGGFFGDLEDLERFLYYLLHSGAKNVHLHVA